MKYSFIPPAKLIAAALLLTGQLCIYTGQNLIALKRFIQFDALQYRLLIKLQIHPF